MVNPAVRTRRTHLIELLVVIAIIAIGLIFLPALVSAKERVILNRCMNNLYQIGTALFVYAATTPPVRVAVYNTATGASWAWDMPGT